MRKVETLPSIIVDPIMASTHDAVYWNSSLHQFQRFFGVGKINNVYIKVPGKNLLISKRLIEVCDAPAIDYAIEAVTQDGTPISKADHQAMGKLCEGCDDLYHIYHNLFDKRFFGSLMDLCRWLDSEVAFIDVQEREDLAKAAKMDEVIDSLEKLCLAFLRAPLKERLEFPDFDESEMLSARTDVKHYALRALMRLLLDQRPTTYRHNTSVS